VVSADPGGDNAARYRPGHRGGHYESFYLRANHPRLPLGWWIRYTVHSPAGRPADAVGELWCVLFDGDRPVAARHAWPVGEFSFAREGFAVQVGGAQLGPGRLAGEIPPGPGPAVAWDLCWTGTGRPLHLLPARAYRARFPPAKSLVPEPLARFSGQVRVGDRVVPVDGWTGSQNHNWGTRHTDRYAFGQVAGFDDAPDSVLEVVTAAARVGRLRTPMATLLVLRHEGTRYALNSTWRSLRASARVAPFEWRFATGDARVRVSGRFTAPPESFVGLAYADPPGGTKYCLNSGIAGCELTVEERASGARRTLRSAHGAMLETLDDDPERGVPIVA
jgi:hypothetical protein